LFKLRVTFAKSKDSMYLSHLDIMSVFERSFRRANILVEYSNGHTKRPEIVFAHPLSVGIESTGEIFEVILKEKIDIVYFIREVNRVLPKSITILHAEYVDLNEKNIMARVYAAIYTIEFCYNDNTFENKDNKQIEVIQDYYKNKMLEYLKSEFMLVLKKSKDRSERIDIKPLIIDYSFIYNNKLQVTISTGSKNNLKPEYIMKGYIEYIGEEFNYNIKREKILFK
jgi:radical SAM-linked protein